jgi:hypothetical protein
MAGLLDKLREVKEKACVASILAFVAHFKCIYHRSSVCDRQEPVAGAMRGFVHDLLWDGSSLAACFLLCGFRIFPFTEALAGWQEREGSSYMCLEILFAIHLKHLVVCCASSLTRPSPTHSLAAQHRCGDELLAHRGEGA